MEATVHECEVDLLKDELMGSKTKQVNNAMFLLELYNSFFFFVFWCCLKIKSFHTKQLYVTVVLDRVCVLQLCELHNSFCIAQCHDIDIL